MVHQAPDVPAGFPGGDRHGNHQARGPLGPERRGRGGHRGPGREPVVHQDHGLAGHVGRRLAGPIAPLAPVQLLLLRGGDRGQLGIGHPEAFHDRAVHHPDAPGRDGSHGQLRVGGDAELAHDEDVERCPQRAGHFVSDRHPAPRQGEDQDIGSIGILAQLRREAPTCFGTVAIASGHPGLTQEKWTLAAGTPGGL